MNIPTALTTRTAKIVGGVALAAAVVTGIWAVSRDNSPEGKHAREVARDLKKITKLEGKIAKLVETKANLDSKASESLKSIDDSIASLKEQIEVLKESANAKPTQTTEQSEA